jgi:hypothetical protein
MAPATPWNKRSAQPHGRALLARGIASALRVGSGVQGAEKLWAPVWARQQLDPVCAPDPAAAFDHYE